MGVYSSKSTSGTIQVEAVECKYDNMMEASLAIVAESQYNYGIMMKAIGVEELSVYEETGAEMVYTEASGEGFIAKIIEFFKNIWAKIKGLFNKFLAMFDSYARSDKAFIDKYKKDLYSISHSLKDFKFNGYVFSIDSHDDVKTVYSKARSAAPTASESDVESAKKARENSEDIYEKMRGASIGKGTLTQSEFTKELFMLFRSNEDSKKEITHVDINKIVGELEDPNKIKKTVEDNMKALEKEINDIIAKLEKEKNSTIKDMPDAEKQKKIDVININTQFDREALNIAQTFNGALLTAIKDRSRQNKSVCVSLMHYKPKTEQSSSWTHESSFLGGVNFK